MTLLKTSSSFFATASQENRLTSLCPVFLSFLHLSGSDNKANIAWAKPSMSLGSTKTAAEWKFSFKAGRFERMHGKPAAMASATTSPKPSALDGNTKIRDDLSRRTAS